MAPAIINTIALMDAEGMKRALLKISYEILARNEGPGNLAIMGLQTRGVFLARRIADIINATEHVTVPVGILDVTMYRDDYRSGFHQSSVKVTDIPFEVDDTTIVLVDDVLYTGRTIRAALDAIMDYGRPRQVKLAVLIDRGGRELPFAADYIGKAVKTLPNQEIQVRMAEVPGENNDDVTLVTYAEERNR